MPLYIADYLADTAHLSAAEHGAYLLLIMHYFRNGELPKDDKKLQRISRMTAREWEASRETIAAFFDADWKHKRIENEIDKSLRKSHARATSGSRGGHAKSLKNKEAALANATILLQQTGKQNDDFALASSSLSHTELVRENNQHTDLNYLLSDFESDDAKSIDKIEGVDRPVKTRKTYSEAFEQFWNAYPTDKMMSKSNASKQFTKLSPEDRQAVIAAVEPFKVWLAAQKDYRTLHAERFISQRRFDGFRPDEGTPRLVASNFYAKAGSAELEAWDAHWRLTKGKSAPRDKHGGWYFPTEFPTNERSAA